MAVNPLVIVDAAVPGEANSYYSEQKSLATPGTGAYTVIPEIGWIQAIAVSAISYNLRTDDGSPEAYSVVIPANTPGMTWSDGTNLFVSKSSGGSGNALYYVLQHKP